MSDQPIPTNNPAKTLFRIVLWFLPTGFAVLCGFGCFQLPFRFRWSYELSFTLWLALTIIFTVGAGWFNQALSNRAKLENCKMFLHVFLFLVAQVILIPLIVSSLIFAACVTHPLKF